MNGDNTMKIYLFTGQAGSGSKLSFCTIPPNVGVVAEVLDSTGAVAVAANAGTASPASTCEYWTNFDTEEVSDFTTTADGFDLNVISIKRNAATNTQIDLKIGTGDWVNLYYKV